jgi:REP element-mobilizing transposase RayT
MRTARAKHEKGTVGYYHCISRVVDRQFVLGREEKEHLVKLMRGYEAFCGVKVITYCVMSNHFHILVEVPERPAPRHLPTDAQLVALVRKAKDCYGSATLEQDLKRLRAESADAEAADALRERFFCRMWDVSWFVRLLKQRFTQWFNKRRNRKGTLWEDRFKSVLVEGAGNALCTMAIYIDLNPVRAGIVPDPGEYRWCGYAQGMAGLREAREGLAVVVNAVRRGVAAKKSGGAAVVPQRILAEYRLELFGRGESRGIAEDGRALRLGISQDRINEVLQNNGRLKRWEATRCRVRYFSDGLILGSRQFVDRFFASNRWRFGKQRKDGARALRYVDLPGLFTIRDLQKAPVGC